MKLPIILAIIAILLCPSAEATHKHTYKPHLKTPTIPPPPRVQLISDSVPAVKAPTTTDDGTFDLVADEEPLVVYLETTDGGLAVFSVSHLRVVIPAKKGSDSCPTHPPSDTPSVIPGSELQRLPL